MGCGQIGGGYRPASPQVKLTANHATAYAQLSDMTLVAACDPSSDARKHFRAQWPDVRLYDDADQMLQAEHPDVVSVCAPTSEHEKLNLLAIRHGVRAILCEKPFTDGLEAAQKVLAAADDAGVRLGVNYTRRWDPGHQKVFARFRRETRDDTLCFSGRYCKGILNNGSHMLDLLVGCLGMPDAVRAEPGFDDEKSDPTPWVFLYYGLRLRAVMQPFPVEPYSIFEYDITDASGRVRFLDSGFRITTEVPGPSPWYSNATWIRPSPPVEGEMESCLLEALRNLREAALTGRAMRCTGADALRVHQLHRAIRCSLQSIERIEISNNNEVH